MKRGLTILIVCVVFMLSTFVMYSVKNTGKNYIPSTKKNNATTKELPLNWPWRGITIETQYPDNIDSLSIKSLKDKGVNFISLFVNIRQYTKFKKISVDKAINENFELCDNIIRWCKKENIAVMLACIQFPLDPTLNITQSDMAFWSNEDLLNQSINFIGKFVQHFDHLDNVVGYDFFSEPVMKDIVGRSLKPLNWENYYYRMLKEIRRYSQKYVTYSPPPWGRPQDYLTMKNPIQDDKIIYNFHFYEPHEFTHQGIKSYQHQYAYPGIISGKQWNREVVRNEMLVPYEWCQKNSQLLYAGEFSAVCWAEGRETYLKDVLSVFEEFNISYSFFTYDGWKGWSFDYQADESHNVFTKIQHKTKTLEILESYWGLNKKK